MLQELCIENLGVIEQVKLVLADSLVALTGETGAGKTMVVEAISLLVGSRADSAMIRTGCEEATIEGRFVDGDDETILTRVVPRDGRSRAYINGRLATVGQLTELGSRLVDLHGQHAHQSLLGTAEQRAALDAFGEVDLNDLDAARSRVTELDAELATLGGDERQRAREIDLLSFQVSEIEAAAIASTDEDERLNLEEDVLANADALRESLWGAVAVLSEDDGAVDRVGQAISFLDDSESLAGFVERLRAVQGEVSDLGAEMRSRIEEVEEDPERLAFIRERLNMLSELRRKYGERLSDVVEYLGETRVRLTELIGYEDRARVLSFERDEALAQLTREQTRVLEARTRAAVPLAEATEAHLRRLAMPHARVAIDVQGGAGEQVTFLLSANPGSHPLPLAKVASGGELARAMLALRLVLTRGPSTLIFDEVDAGIGGEAAAAVGEALREIASRHQVLVVTHLAQVAASAASHLRVIKRVVKGQTFAGVEILEGDLREAEVARMLAGNAEEAAARAHAKSLLQSRHGGKRSSR